MSVSWRVSLVTPTDAKVMLSQMYKKQRPVSKPHVDKIAQDIKAGRFLLSPDAVVRLKSGEYVNGQHRLLAIVKTGIAAEMVISEGWPDGTYEIMDSGIRRKLAHRVEFPWMASRNSAVGMVRMAATVPVFYTSKISERTVVAAAAVCEPHFEKAAHLLKKHKSFTAPIGAAFARAIMNGVHHSTVDRFADVLAQPALSNGPHESAAILLHQRLNEGLWNGEQRRFQLYQMATRAVQLFASESPAKLLKSHEQDIYPRPQELVAVVVESTASDEKVAA